MAGDFLVPLLRSDGGAPDPVAIETWHVALGATVAIEIPHDLFALWLFPPRGGSVLLGPAALAEDRIEVPHQEPILQQDALYRLEETLRKARYPSAIAAPVRPPGGTRDLGVMLLGSFEKGVFGPREALALHRLGTQLAPALLDLGERLAAPSPGLVEHLTRDNLPEHLARMACEASDGADLVRRASGALYELIPHDRLEILAASPGSGILQPLSRGPARRRWVGGAASEPADPLSAIAPRFGEARTLLLPDLTEVEGISWTVESPPVPVHGLIGAKLTVSGETIGYLILGSVARDAFRPEDEDTLALAALFLAPRVQALRGGGASHSGASAPADALEDPPLSRAAAALAGTGELRVGLHRFGEELGRVLPHDGIAVYLRRGEYDVVTLEPELARPLADLRGIPLEDFTGSPLFLEGKEWLSTQTRNSEEVLVPLGVGGRTIGALGVKTTGSVTGRAAAAIARQFADVLAPHVELVRRAGDRDQGSGVRELLSPGR
jgi:hypothetical protein